MKCHIDIVKPEFEPMGNLATILATKMPMKTHNANSDWILFGQLQPLH